MSYGLKSISGFVWFSAILQILYDATFASHIQFDEKTHFSPSLKTSCILLLKTILMAIFDDDNVNKQSILWRRVLLQDKDAERIFLTFAHRARQSCDVKR